MIAPPPTHDTPTAHRHAHAPCRHVIKINNQKRRQERVIGVDMTRIYNSKPKDKKFHFKGVTKKWRDIEDLESCPWCARACLFSFFFFASVSV